MQRAPETERTTRGAGRILIAEDAPDLRALLRLQLEGHGYDVFEAEHGERALELLDEADPDVVLLDIDMPVLDGFDVLARLKADRATANIPVVFITGRATAEDAAKGLDLGAHDYLRKPFDAPELAARVQAAMRTKRLQDDLRQLNGELARQARTDGLTRLPNRRFLDEQLARACSRATRHGQPLCLLILDLDHFKQVNDRFGHPAGDEALVAVSERLSERLRMEDILGRWGGEEFMVIAPDCNAEGASTLAEALRRCVEETSVDLRGTPVDMTISVGWATYGGDGPEELVRSADKALYAAKDAGRNCVVAAPA